MVIGGGFKAIRSVLHYSRKIGPWQLWRALKSKNACKACAFGTGGQKGGIHNETGKGIEFCNKNIQAHLSDIRPSIPLPIFLQRTIADLRAFDGKDLEDLGRLTTPLYKAAGDTHYTPIRYEDALQRICQKFKQTPPDRSFFYASGRSANEAAYLLQIMARLYGTNNINNCSYYCHQASGVALQNGIGSGTATVEFADLERADLVFVIGANPASNHPRFVKALLKLRRRGGQVIVINPAREAGLVRFASPSDWRSMLRGGEDIASLYIQPHLGGDCALLYGIAKSLVHNHQINDDFIQHYTAGFANFKQHIEALDWAEIEVESGVDRNQIATIAGYYARANSCIFSWSMGLTHHTHGVHNIQAVVSLALLRGMIGKPGAGLLPLRGHSNIQGTGSMGFTPKLKTAFETALQQKLGYSLPQQNGLDTMACMEASARGDMDCAFMLGGNLLASNPDLRFAEAALNTIPFKVFLNPTLNISHVRGVEGEVIILPVRARDEEQQATTQESMFNFVRLSDGGIQRFPQLLSEVDIIVRIGTQLIDKTRFDFQRLTNYQQIRQWIATTVPGFAALEKIDQSKQEFHIDGRILHEPIFATASGKGLFIFNPLSKRSAADLMLTTVRSEGQFNSIIYHRFDSYRQQQQRDVVLLNPQDIQRLGLRENQRVNLISATGSLPNVLVRPFDIRPGNAMTYYPEANVLVPKKVDPNSRTPGFKSVAIHIEAV